MPRGNLVIGERFCSPIPVETWVGSNTKLASPQIMKYMIGFGMPGVRNVSARDCPSRLIKNNRQIHDDAPVNLSSTVHFE